MILSKEEKDSWDLMIPEDNGLDNKPPVKVPNKHIIPADSILVNKELGTGEFGVVQQGVWTNEGERVRIELIVIRKCILASFLYILEYFIIDSSGHKMFK